VKLAWSFLAMLVAVAVVSPVRGEEFVPFDRARDDAPSDLRTRKDGADWPGFLGPTADSKSTERGILTAWPETGPPLVWQRRVLSGYGMPSVSLGRLFQFERIGKEATLLCLNSETGEELWRFAYSTSYSDIFGYDNGPRCAPVIDGGRVYLFGVEGMLYCLRVSDGKPVWKVDTAAQFDVVQNFFGVGSTPVVFQDLLIAQIGGSPKEDLLVPPGQLDAITGNGSGVVAFDKYTGEVRYQSSDELASYAGPTLAEIGGRPWCFVFARGGLLGFDPATGQQDFHFPWRAKLLESVNASNPVVVGDQVLISETYGPGAALLKVKPGGYDVVWSDDDRNPRNKRLQTHWNTPVYVDGYVYASSGRHAENADLRCMELTTGKTMWSQPGLTRCSLLYVDGHLVCLAEQGTLLLLKVNPERYEEIARADVPDTSITVPAGTRAAPLLKYPAWAAPILSHGLLYVRGRDRLVCLELIPARN
jgi:outer membrane protein assembly factor BamB